MASTPRYEGQDVVNAFNLYIDSERSNVVGDKQSRGDNVHYNFEGNTVECRDGEVMKMSLVDFHMPNNFYNVETKNSFARIKITGGGATGSNIDLHNYTVVERGNYYDVQDVATNFAYTVGNILNGLCSSIDEVVKITNNTLVRQQTSLITGGTPNYIVPSPVDTVGTSQLGRPDTKMLDVTIEFNDAHGITVFFISCLSATGESYLLLGGERNDDINTTGNAHSSFLIDLAPTVPATATPANCIRIRGYFPMQLTTEPHVYLRTTLGQNGLESAILARDADTYNTEIIGSDILAKIPRNLESFSYIANGGADDFFIYYQQRKLNQIRLYLTDSKGRPIGRAGVADTLSVYGSGTAAGLEGTAPSIPPLTTDRLTFVNTKQSTLGNLYFTATLKIEIIKKSSPTLLDFPPPPFPPVPTKLNTLTFGDKYAKT
jgi:hypothetical protein